MHKRLSTSEKVFSLRLYEAFYRYPSQPALITLTNGRRLQGVITGYFKADPDDPENYISAWRIQKLQTWNESSYENVKSEPPGIVIETENIAAIHYLEDNCIIACNGKQYEQADAFKNLRKSINS